MDSQSVNTQSSMSLLLIVLLCLSIFCLVVFLNVPIARQVIGFFYLTLVPGYVFLRLLKLEDLGSPETILFSIGFSIAFLMFAGLLVNEIGYMIGFPNPLTLVPLAITLNVLVIAFGILAHIKNMKLTLPVIQFRKVPLQLPFLFSIPIISVIGAVFVKSYGNNIILIFLLLLISSIFAVGMVLEKLLPPRLYALAIFVIAISLLYHSLLISDYIVSYGSDVPTELGVFQNTQSNAYWGATEFVPRFDAMLSITVLPTFYSNLLNIDPTWTFKMLFPIIFSFVPLALYRIWKRYIGEKYAFSAAFLFMAERTLYFEMVSLNRQITAELFFVLLLLVLLSDKMKPRYRVVCFMIFAFGLVTSHYALSEIFLFFISLTFIFSFLAKRPSRNIEPSMIALFFVVMFSWYIYTSGSAVYDSIVDYSNYVYSQVSEFFNPASRGGTVLRGLGLEAPPAMLNAVSRAFAYSTQLLIVVGFVGLITRRVRYRIDRTYSTFVFIAIVFLFALLLVPGLAETLSMSRFYHILLFFLAPLSMIGATFLVGLLSKRREKLLASILLLIVLIPYFLFQTNFVYEVTGGDSWSLPLSKYKMDSLRLYGGFGFIDAYSVFGVQWLSKTVNADRTRIYSDSASQRNPLIAYGGLRFEEVRVLSNTTKISSGDTVYLSPLNVADGKIVGEFSVFNSSELSFLNQTNTIYANGKCEIRKGT